MRHTAIEPLFENRYDAGRKLAEKLTAYSGQSIVVLGIPNGGVAVAVPVALALNADLGLVISRKIPIPLNPEAGFGSLTDDGTLILNEKLVKELGLTQQQINYQVAKVRENIKERSLLYHKDRVPLSLAGRIVIIIDDGLASGYTMRAAVESARKQRPAKVIAAVPVGPERTIQEIAKVADSVVVYAISRANVFAVADYYRQWYDVPDSEVLSCLKEWRMRRNAGKIQLSEKKRKEI